ncbi:MAG: CinA family protein [Actinomycetales bacterium]|nr:CinA family protein [Actinomycetales bacterium]
MTLAGNIVSTLASRGQTVAVAESLTGGLLAAALVDVPGASTAFAGGVVTYQPEQKVRQLGLDPELIATRGTVDPDVAVAMASAVRAKFGTDYAVSTTGVAGPGDSEGKPAGTVYIGLCGPQGSSATRLTLAGDRFEVRMLSVSEALSGLAAILGEQS